METIGDRISETLKARGRSIRSFQQGLASQNVKGSSYPNVHAIIKGTTEPPLTFVEAAARELGVSVLWLAFGVDYADPGRAEVGGIAAEAKPSADIYKRRDALNLKLDVLAGLGVPDPDLPDFPDDERLDGTGISGDDTQPRFREWIRHVNARHIPHWVAPLAEVRRRLAVDGKTIGAALRGPLTALGINPAMGVDASNRVLDWMNDYIMSMAPVLLTLAPIFAAATSRAAREESDDA